MTSFSLQVSALCFLPSARRSIQPWLSPNIPSLKLIECLSVHLLHGSQSKTVPDIQPHREKSRLLKSSSESKWLDFSWRGQRVWREVHPHSPIWDVILNPLQSSGVTVLGKQHHLPVLWSWRFCLYNQNTDLLWSFPEQFSGEAQIKMTMKLITYLV